MQLNKYLSREGISASQFAAKVGCPPSTITRILNGTRSPRLGTIRRIEEATDGAVTARDYIALPAPSKAERPGRFRAHGKKVGAAS